MNNAAANVTVVRHTLLSCELSQPVNTKVFLGAFQRILGIASPNKDTEVQRLKVWLILIL